MLYCSICEEEVPFHTGTDEQNIVCKQCVRLTKDSKAGKTSSTENFLQTIFEKSLEVQPKGLIEMKRLTLYCNFARDKVVMFDDVVVRFDENGKGSTPEHNRSKVTKFMKQRPGRVSIVEDTSEEVVVAEPVVEAAPPPPEEEPKKEEESVPTSTKDLAPVVEEKVEASEKTQATPKKRGRKSKKDTENN